MTPKAILEQTKEFYQLIDANPQCIDLPDVAQFLGVNAEWLRCAIDQGRASFGFSWKKAGKGNRAYKIPTLVFWNWVTQGNAKIFLEEYIK